MASHARKRATTTADATEPAASPRRLGLPGFITEEVGLGDVVSQTFHSLGIPRCGGCQQRTEALNRWLVFTPGRGQR